MKLRDYQQRAIDMIRAELRAGRKRVLVTLPTGAGKSIIMGHIARGCLDKGNKVLALMHRRGLVEQLGDRFASCGVDSGTVMSGIDSKLSKGVQIGTIQTYHRRRNFEEYDFTSGELFRPWEHKADVILCDEAHRSLAKTFQEILTAYKDKVVLGFTATPTLSSGWGMGRYYQTLIQPVDVKELIDCGSLVPGAYYGLPAPDLADIKIVAGDYEKKTLSERVIEQKLIGSIVENWLRIAAGKKTLCFAVDVKHSISITHEFMRAGVPAEHLDAHSDDDKRNATLDRFKAGETQVLCNCELFCEGTDIPELQCVCLAKPTKSIGRYLQMIGRGARPYPGKYNFLVLDHGKNVNEHGFYEEPIIWTLDGKKISYYKPEPREPKEKHKMECRMCGAIFTGGQCPQCYTKVENYGKKIEALEYDLKELGKVRELTAEKKRSAMLRKYPAKVLAGMLLYESTRLGKTDKWIRANYRAITDKWPQTLDVRPLPATQDLKGWLQYRRIKWIKEQQKLKNTQRTAA